MFILQALRRVNCGAWRSQPQWDTWPPGRGGLNIGRCWKECRNRGRLFTELSVPGGFVPRGRHGVAATVPAHKPARILEVI